MLIIYLLQHLNIHVCCKYKLVLAGHGRGTMAGLLYTTHVHQYLSAEGCTSYCGNAKWNHPPTSEHHAI